MRVAHVVTVPASLMFLRGQLSYLRERGVEFFAVASPGPELDDFVSREGIPTTAIAMARAITPLRDLVAVAQLIREFRRLRPDIVHAHTPKAGLLGMIAARAAGVRVRIYHMRGLPVETASGLRRMLLWSTEFVACSLADRVFCVGNGLRATAIDFRVCSAVKLKVFGGGSGNGVDALGRFRPPADDELRTEKRASLGIPSEAVVIGFVGRLVRDKGVLELADAWKTLRKNPNCHLVLVGPEEERDALPRSTLEELRADPRVHLVGSVKMPEHWYPAFDVVALPTYREGFPNVLLEAAAMGLPVVATAIPGCVDAVDEGNTGLLVPVRDTARLAAAIERYVRSPQLRAQHGSAGRDRVLRLFLPTRIWAEIHQEYLALLAEAPGATKAAKAAGLSTARTDERRM